MISAGAVGAGSAAEMPRQTPFAEFRGDVNPVNPRVSDSFCGELIRVSAVPNGLAAAWFAHWNGSAAQLDNEHRPLILVQATEPERLHRPGNDRSQSCRIRWLGRRARELARRARCRVSSIDRPGHGTSTPRATQCWSRQTRSAQSCRPTSVSRSPSARCSAMCAEGR